MPPEASLVPPHGRGLSLCPGLYTAAAGEVEGRAGPAKGRASGGRDARRHFQAGFELASRKAARTSTACPSGLTLGQTRSTRPSGPTRKLDRRMPQ